MVKKLAAKRPPPPTAALSMPAEMYAELGVLLAEFGMGMSADYAEGATLTEEQNDHRAFISEAYGNIVARIMEIFATDEDAFNALSLSGFLHEFFNFPLEQCNQTTSQALLRLLHRIKPRKAAAEEGKK